MTDSEPLRQAAERLFDLESHQGGVESNGAGDSAVYAALHKIRGLMDSFQATVSEHDLSDQQWDRLQVKEMIGQGGMGEVYQAMDPILNRPVALKVLNSRAKQFIDADRFVAEAQRMAQVRHPHIMAVYGAGSHQGITAYWGELLRGEKLDDFIKSNQPDAKQRVEFAIQLSEAVEAIHRKQWVHADIKNANIIIEKGRGAVLMDFGASVDLQVGQQGLFHPSTPLAMAPEQFHGDPPSPASDVFSLGVVYHLLFCGEYPFAGENYEQLKGHVIAGKKRRFEGQVKTEPQLTQLIIQMLDTEPNKRPDIHAVKAQLLNIQARPLQRAKRNVLILGAVLLLSLALGSLYTAYQTQQTNEQILQAQTETQAVNEVLEQMLKSPATIEKGKDVLMLDVVEDVVADINENDHLPGHAKGRLQYAMAATLNTLGATDQARELYQQITESPSAGPFTIKNAWIQLARHNTDHLDFEQAEAQLGAAKAIEPFADNWVLSEAELMAGFARLHQNQQNFAQSTVFSQRAIELFDQLGGHKSETVVLILMARNHMYLGQYPQAEAAFAKAHQHAVKHNSKRDHNAIIAQTGLAAMLSVQGKLAESQAVFDELVPLARDFLGPEHRLFFSVRFNLAVLLTKSKKYQEALAVQLELLNEGTQYGVSEIGLAQLKGNIANQYVNLERFDDAEQMFLEVIEEVTALASPNHRSVFQNAANYADLLNDLERSADVLSLLNPIADQAKATLGAEHQIVLLIEQERAWAMYQQGQVDTALGLMQGLLPVYQKNYGADDERTIELVEQWQLISKTAKQTQ